MHQGGAGVTRWMASCPLCRRDVHFLLPLYDPEHPRSPPPPHGVIINEEHAKPVSIALTSAVEPSASREHTAGTNPGETSPSTTWHAKLFTQTLRKKLVIECLFYTLSMMVFILGFTMFRFVCLRSF